MNHTMHLASGWTYCRVFTLQEEVISTAGQEAVELGLLFGTESNTLHEEEPDVLSFGHKSLQEFVGGKYVAEMSQVPDSNFVTLVTMTISFGPFFHEFEQKLRTTVSRVPFWRVETLAVSLTEGVS